MYLCPCICVRVSVYMSVSLCSPVCRYARRPLPRGVAKYRGGAGRRLGARGAGRSPPYLSLSLQISLSGYRVIISVVSGVSGSAASR